MKATHGLSAVMLLSTLLGTVATDAAVARPRHPVSADDSGHASKLPAGGQKSGGEPRGGLAKNLTPGTSNNNAGANAGDKGSLNSNGPTEVGPMKKGDNLPGKSGPPTTGKGAGDAGKNQFGEGGDGNRRGATHPGATNGAAEHGIDPIRTDNVIVDHSDRKSKKPVIDTTKKVTTTVPTPASNGTQRPSAITAIGGGEKNAVGLALRNDKDPKQGKDAKIDARPPLESGLPGPAGIKTNAIAAPTNISHPATNPIAADGAPKIGTGLNGTLISRPGSGPSTIGGPMKNVASINGTSFRPKRGH